MTVRSVSASVQTSSTDKQNLRGCQ